MLGRPGDKALGWVVGWVSERVVHGRAGRRRPEWRVAIEGLSQGERDEDVNQARRHHSPWTAPLAAPAALAMGHRGGDASGLATGRGSGTTAGGLRRACQ